MQLYLHIGELIYYHSEHTMENGEVADGVINSDWIAKRSEVASRISEELKRWLVKRLDDGLTTRQVFEEYKKVWYESWTKNKKYSEGNFLLLKHVRYYEYQRKKTFGIDQKKNTFVSVNMWKLENPNVVFYYQNDDATTGVPFIICIQTPLQKTTLLKYRRDECISMDPTFGTNDLMYHLFTLVVLMSDTTKSQLHRLLFLNKKKFFMIGYGH